MRKVVHAEEGAKPNRDYRKHFGLRVNLFFFITFALFSVLVVRLALLQFVEGKAYEAARNRHLSQDVTVAPIRGNIFDANLFPIAYTVSSQSLFYRIEPKQTKQDWIALAKKLEAIIGEYGDPSRPKPTAADLIKLMDVGIDLNGRKTREPGYNYLPRRLATHLTKEEIAYIAEHRDELPGLELAEESRREYSLSDGQSIASQLVGYVRPYSVAMNQSDSYLNFYKETKDDYGLEEYVGFDGLEFMYQSDLRGKNGSKTYPVNSLNQIIGNEQITPPEKGHNLQLTLNKDIQLEAQRAIEEHLQLLQSSPPSSTYSLGAQAVAGYAVAMEVNTGRVVAMANYPDYDPNIWLKGAIPQDDYDRIQYRYPNGTIRERFPDIADAQERRKHPSSLVYLGSTMKPLTVLLGLNEGLLTPYSVYDDDTAFVYGKDGSTINNSDHAHYGRMTATDAIAHSSNTFMAAMIGNAMYMSKKYKTPMDAVKVWDSYMEQFGLGVSTGSGLPGESAGLKDYLAAAKKYSPQAALVLASFGQQGKYTVLQLAQYASMLANKGKRYKPLFVDNILSYDGKQVIKHEEPELLNQVDLPDEYWNVVYQGMSRVFVRGFDDAPYTYLRKTGTSEQDLPGAGRIENAVFLAFAPADHPKLAVAVVVPEGGFGSWGAAPIARRIFDAYDRYVGLDGTPKGP